MWIIDSWVSVYKLLFLNCAKTFGALPSRWSAATDKQAHKPCPLQLNHVMWRDVVVFYSTVGAVMQPATSRCTVPNANLNISSSEFTPSDSCSMNSHVHLFPYTHSIGLYKHRNKQLFVRGINICVRYAGRSDFTAQLLPLRFFLLFFIWPTTNYYLELVPNSYKEVRPHDIL